MEQQCFQAIGAQLGGLKKISSKLLDCSEAWIQVQKNTCGYLPASIDINTKFESFVVRMNATDISVNKPRSSFKVFSIADSSNPLDIQRFQEALADEESRLG